MIPPMPAAAHWFVVVNPAAAGGRAARGWRSLARGLAGAGVGLEAVHTARPGHATVLAREAVRAGHRRLLAVGGDGVLHEVVNGLMTQEAVEPRELCVGAAPLGSGNDWARSRGIPRRLPALVRCLARARSAPHDVGLLDFPDATGRSYFINVAGAGFDAYVLERLPPRAPRRLAYLFGVLDSLRSYRPPRFTLEAASGIVEARMLLALVAIGPYCGGGMRLAPPARPDDGLLDLVTVDPVSMPRDLPKLRHLFDGRLLEQPFVRHSVESRVQIASDPPVAVEADGQLVGRTPVRVRLLPKAILALAG